MPNQILQKYLSLYSHSIRGHEYGHFKQITVFQLACTVRVNRLDTKNVINSFHNIWRAWKRHHSRVNSDALCVKDRLHVLLKTLCDFLMRAIWLYLIVINFNVNSRLADVWDPFLSLALFYRFWLVDSAGFLCFYEVWLMLPSRSWSEIFLSSGLA